MGRPIIKGSTDQSTVIRILDSTTFLPENAVEYNTGGIDLWYRREQETKTSIVEAALAALDSAHSDGGIELIGDGYYRLDLPDAAVAAGAGENSVQIGGTITGMIVIGNEHALVDYDPYNAVNMGMSALPNAAANAAGGMATSAAGGLNLDTIADWEDGERLDLLLDAIPTTAMRGTDNAALASVVGALNDVAAAGEVTDADTLVQYIKQLINVLIGAAGITTFPAEAAPGDAVSLAEVIRAIHVDVTGLNGDAMRGTDGANTTTPPTVGEIQTEMEENGASLLDTIRDQIGTAGDGLTALGDARIANLDATVSTRATPAQVNAEVVDALNVDTYAEPGQGNPPATATLVQKIGYPYKAYRNKRDQDATTKNFYNDAGDTVDQKRTIADNGVTYSETEVVSGP